MIIRKAHNKDIKRIGELLYQVNDVHYKGRPDLFVRDGRKYTDDELIEIFRNESTPVFVAVDDEDEVEGYAFCMFTEHQKGHSIKAVKSLYIDDLCVDERQRGKHIGSTLYNYVLDFARSERCYNVTLNVWTCNPSAMKFYKKCGLKPQKVGMEKTL